MKSVCVSLGYDQEALAPIHEGICTSPKISRELILGGHAVDGIETITSFVYGDTEVYESLLTDLESVREYEMTPAEEGFFLYLRRDLGPDGRSLLDALTQETVVVVPPMEVRSDRTIRLTLVGHSSALSSVIEEVAAGTTIDILWTSDRVTTTETPVSERQLAALETAWELGYYEVPRRNGIETVAEALDCAISTASELLRRGEARVIGQTLERQR